MKKELFESIVAQIADLEGVPIDFVKSEMQKSLDFAWDNTNEEIKARRNGLFPDGKPEPEDFMIVLANLILNDD